jgi:simple sugar transport system ATP-binding protein
VEILKALLRDPPLLALDEPTAVLSPPEVEALFGLLRGLAAEGHAVLLVAHKIDEVLRVADRVTVLRAGRTTLSAPRSEVDAPALIRAMVGRDVRDGAAVGWGSSEGMRPEGAGEPVAVLDGVRVLDDASRTRLDDVTLTVRRGEIVGIAGVEGNGQRGLAHVLAGRRSPAGGTARLPARIGFVPQDRTREGLVGDFDLAENMALALHDDPALTRGAFVRWDAIRERAEDVRQRYGVRAPSVEARAYRLSGGTQQRHIVGR